MTNTTQNAKAQRGFSLVEMSIVLVIIGLLVGGVLFGRNLIHASELQSVGKQAEEYTRAFNTFRQRYNGLPGDLPNATDIWGAADSDYNTCAYLTTPSVGTETCNGNGDGYINYWNQEHLTTGNREIFERHRAWQHLANAELVVGPFTGVTSNPSEHKAVTPGINAPISKIDGAGWTIMYMGSREVQSYLFQASYGHSLLVGRKGDEATTNPFLSAEDAWSVDNKFDDGKPGRGDIMAFYSRTDCHTAANTADHDADYALSTPGITCSLIFRNLF